MPIESLTLDQGVQLLRDPKSADHPGARTWGELGLEGEWAKTPITLYGRSAGAGAWGYLVNRFLGEGAASRQAVDCAGYAEICQSVAKNRGGVGYVSLSLAPPEAGKVLPLHAEHRRGHPAAAAGAAGRSALPAGARVVCRAQVERQRQAVAAGRGVPAIRAEPLGAGGRREGRASSRCVATRCWPRATSSAGPASGKTPFQTDGSRTPTGLLRPTD